MRIWCWNYNLCWLLWKLCWINSFSSSIIILRIIKLRLILWISRCLMLRWILRINWSLILRLMLWINWSLMLRLILWIYWSLMLRLILSINLSLTLRLILWISRNFMIRLRMRWRIFWRKFLFCIVGGYWKLFCENTGPWDAGYAEYIFLF